MTSPNNETTPRDPGKVEAAPRKDSAPAEKRKAQGAEDVKLNPPQSHAERILFGKKKNRPPEKDSESDRNKK